MYRQELVPSVGRIIFLCLAQVLSCCILVLPYPSFLLTPEVLPASRYVLTPQSFH